MKSNCEFVPNEQFINGFNQKILKGQNAFVSTVFRFCLSSELILFKSYNNLLFNFYGRRSASPHTVHTFNCNLKPAVHCVFTGYRSNF